MHQVGIVVEGPTVFDFWKRLLPRLYPASCELVDVVAERDQGSLIRRADLHLRANRDAGFRATFFVVDLDAFECVRRVLDRFPESVRLASLHDDDASICVAVKGAESWYLADAEAVNAVFVGSDYRAADNVERLNPKATLREMGGRYNKWWLARQFGNAFDPRRAVGMSPSLDRAWRLMAPVLQQLEDEVWRGRA